MENINQLNWSWKTYRTTQEHLQYFDVSFTDDPTDVLFCDLNDIDQCLIKNVNLTEESTTNIEEDSNIIIDPRNKTIISNLILDYSQNGKLLNKKKLSDQFTRESELTKSEHATCLKVLKHQKFNLNISEEEQKIFDETIDIRSKEHTLYKEFVCQHIKSNPIRNILPDIYINYLNLISQHLLERSNKIYSLETGVRLPSEVQENGNGSLNNSKIILNEGYIAQFDEILDLTKLRNYLTNCVNYLPQLNSTKAEHNETDYDIIITDQSFKLFLAPVTDNLEWEIPLKIFENLNGKITLNFDNPLPLRSINYKTNTYIFKELFKISLNFFNDIKWYKIDEDKMNYFNVNHDEEIYAKNLNINYKLKSLDKYKPVINNMDFKSNKMFIECDLCSEKNENLRTLIKSSVQFCDKDFSYINFSPKLEYYPHFGNSNMTQIELLDEWIQQKLLPNSLLKRCRIDANTFEILQIEEISIKQIEDSLTTLYKTNVSALISSLHEFFKTFLKSFPCGDYILKYSANHKDKLIIYREKEPRSENIFDVHNIYGNVIKNSNFIQNFEAIPIDENSYNTYHEINQIYPCCFPYNCNNIGARRNIKKNISKKNTKKIINNIVPMQKPSVSKRKNNSYNKSQQSKNESINKINLPIKKKNNKKNNKNNKNQLKKITTNDIVKTNKLNNLKPYQTRYQKNKIAQENKEKVENFNVDQYLSNFTNNTLTRNEIMKQKSLKTKQTRKKKKIGLK